MDAGHQTVLDKFDPAWFAAHLLSLGSIIAWFLSMLPPIATIAAIVWYVIEIGETRTFRKWIRVRRHRRRAHKRAKAAHEHRKQQPR